MGDLFRDTAAGNLIRFVTRNKLLRYPEEIPGFEFPYPVDDSLSDSMEKLVDSPKIPATISEDHDKTKANAASKDTTCHEDIEQGHNITPPQPTASQVVHPVRTKDAIILVDWYSTDDPANPRNWSSKKKTLVCGEICFLTFTIYLGSSSYASSIPGIVKQFGCSEVLASLGLALYVIAYGVGSLLWSPLSEIPILGRNGLYIGTFFIFTILMIPTAMSNNLPGLFVLRFLTGWFGSPCLSTGPGSFADMLTYNKLPYILTLWAASATLAPALGPISAGYAIEAKDWHWSMWELLWLSSPLFLVLFFLLPETSSDNILLRRAARLRMLTGNLNFRSHSEIKQTHMSAKEIALNALVKPWEINILDPAILFSSVYVALCYAIFYSFFEAFPLVFPVMHGFNLGETGLAFIAIPVGLAIAIPIQLLHFGYVVEPTLMKHGAPAPEFWLKPALVVNIFAPIGLFIFAWTSSPSIHWVVPLVGVVAYQAGSYQIMNSLFAYIPNIYPKYAASLFAANAAARSCLAGGAILFSRPLFVNLGVGGGVSLLAGMMCLCSGLLFVLYWCGPGLRKRSRFVSS